MTAQQHNDGRPWVRADWRYMAKYASISVGSPDAGKYEKQVADAVRASARWSKDNHIGNEWSQHKQDKLERDAATIKRETAESIGGQLLAMGRISARAMQRRAAARGIVLSDTAVADAAADATLTAWRSWCAIQTARRQPMFTPPVGATAQFWQWRRWLRRIVRKVVSRSFSGKSFGQSGDYASLPLGDYHDLESAMAALQDATPALDRTRVLSSLIGVWPEGMQNLAARLLSGHKLTDKECHYARTTLARKGQSIHIRGDILAKECPVTPLRARRRTISLRLAIRPLSKVSRVSVGTVGTLPCRFIPSIPVFQSGMILGDRLV